MEDLDGVVGDPHVNELADQAVGLGIPVPVDIDVIVRRDPAALPASEHIGLVRQLSQPRFVDLGEQFGTAGAEAAHLASIEFIDQHANGGVQFRQGEEALIAQPRQNPALGNLHSNFNFCLIPRAPRPRHVYCGAVMARHLGVGPVETGVIATGIGDVGLQIVADHELRHVAQELDWASQHQYSEGDMAGYKSTRAAMGDMAKSLERDPQLESILAGRKQQLDIQFESGRSLDRELAFNLGIDLGRGRGIGL